MDHLDAEQVARLECLKLVAAHTRGLTPAQYLDAASKLARFVLDGSIPDEAA